MTQAFEEPSEDEVTKRHLKFLMFLIEAATKDPEWNGQLKSMAQAFGEVEQ
jgi:hypothetical protein